MHRKKLLIFHPFIAPYRVDLYNYLNTLFDLKVVCYFKKINPDSLGFDLNDVIKKAEFEFKYSKGGIVWRNRVVDFSLATFLFRFCPDFVLPHEFGFNTLITILFKPLFRYKIYVTTDDSPQMAQNCKLPRRFFRNIVVRFVDGLIVTHPDVAHFLENRYKYSNCKFLFFPILQDEEILKQKFESAAKKSIEKIKTFNLQGRKILLFVGRLENEKGVDILINSFAGAVKNNPDAILIIVGGGSQEQKLKDLVVSLNLQNQVLFKGKLSGDELFAWYNVGQIFVLPSRFEPFGAVVNEALVAGCYTIVSDMVGANSLINSHNGAVFSINHPEQLTRNLERKLMELPPFNDTLIKPNLMEKGLHSYTSDLIKFISNNSITSGTFITDTYQKPQALYFYTYLPPWRIDVFNEMCKYYDLTVLFLNPDVEGFSYSRKILLQKLTANYLFVTNGFVYKNKPFRFGIIKMLLKYKPEVVYSHEYSPASLYLSILKMLRLFSYKLVITTSDNISMLKNTYRLKRLARRIVLNHSEGIIVYSSGVADWYSQKFRNLRVQVCPNIQNPESLLSHQPNFPKLVTGYIEKYQLVGSKIILYTGRLVKIKGLEQLINAFSKTDNTGYKLVLVGEGKMKNSLMEQVAKLNLTDKVVFTGYMDDTKLYAWYSIANFFVLPSTYEPFGAVVNEALVFGCPVMLTKYAGAVDFIKEGVNGFTFDPLNENEFVSGLNSAMKTYSVVNNQRKNIMIKTFEEYLEVFRVI